MTSYPAIGFQENAKPRRAPIELAYYIWKRIRARTVKFCLDSRLCHFEMGRLW
jgi:hypothetical protein